MVDAGTDGTDGTDGASADAQPLTPRSCKELLASAPATPSGMYLIDPDGEGGDPGLTVFCDMVTAPAGGSAGGWTLVFRPDNSDYNTTTLDYTSYTNTLLNDASEALIANRDANLGVVGMSASFALPAAWTTQAPFEAQATDLNLLVTVTAPDHTGQISMAKLRFGYSNWGADCASAWDTTASYGRLCVVNTKAPFFSAFTYASGDYCVESDQPYNAMVCGPNQQFTIAVR